MIVSSLLALTFALPTSEAAGVPTVQSVRIRQNDALSTASHSLVATTSGADTTVASIQAEVASDAGEETLTLLESNAWLHGAASLAALPTTDATLTLDVYDASSTLVATFVGTWSCSAKPDYHQGCIRMKRAAYIQPRYDVDVEVVAGQAFTAPKGYEVAFDLAGSSTYDIAYATLVVTEGKTTTKAEVGWDNVGALWEADFREAPVGAVSVKATSYDSRSKKLDSAKAELATPWVDGGEGVPALPTDEDPFTSLTVRDVKELADILKNDYGIEPAALTVVSDGWTTADALPVAASVELTGGTTLTVPANSYQVASLSTLSTRFGETVDAWFEKGLGDLTFVVQGGADMLVIDSSGSITSEDYLSESNFGISGAGAGAAVVLAGTAYGDWDLSASVFASTAPGLSTKLPLTVSLLDQKGNVVYSEDVNPVFDEEIAVVFSYAVALSEDPIGLGLSGKVKLLGEANTKGKQDTLSKGKFYGSFSRTDDGDYGLAGADKDATSSRGDILIGGEPIGFERTDTNKDGVVTAPPVVVFRTTGNGKGTRAVATGSNGSPGLL